MDKTQDLILGVLTGPQYQMKYPGIEAYVVSLSRCGFTGRKVMIAWNIHPSTKDTLVKYGFEVIDLYPNWPSEPFFHARMRVAWEYLRDHHKEFRYVMWFDIKDFIFQTDPSAWTEQNIGYNQLVGSTECVTIEQEETNQIWARSILGEDKYEEIKNEEVINGGTWIGTSEAMTEVFHQVHIGCQTYSGEYPPCQIWINYVMRQSPFKESLYIPRWEKSFAACLHPCWSPWRTKCWPYLRDKHPVLDLNTVTLHPGTLPDQNNYGIPFTADWGRCVPLILVKNTDPLTALECIVNPKLKPFSVVHGYDRDWNIKSLFDYKYRFNETRHSIPIAEIKEYMTNLASIYPARRSLRPRRLQ